jgi:hypothetical protein
MEEKIDNAILILMGEIASDGENESRNCLPV